MDDDALDAGSGMFADEERSSEERSLRNAFASDREQGNFLPQVEYPEANGDAFAMPVPPESPAPLARSKRRVPFALLGVLTIGVATAGVVAGTSNSGSGIPGAGMSPVDFVVSSTQNTLAQRTADMSFSGNVQVDGHTIPMEGTGQVDFTTGDSTGTIHAGIQGFSMVERVLGVNHNLFMGMTINGMDISGFTGGAHWIEVPIPNANAATGELGGVGNIDPLNQMKLLTQHGASVTPLGTSTIDGVTVSGYSVVPSKAEVDKLIQSEVSSGQIDQSLANQIESTTSALGTFKTDVYFDGSGLMRRVNLNLAGGTAGETASMVESFSNFGVPVSIQAPPGSDVVSFQQFLKDVQSLQST